MHRELLRTRSLVVEHRNRIIKENKSKFLYHSIAPEEAGKREWTAMHSKSILGFGFPRVELKMAIEALFEIYGPLTLAIRSLTKEISLLSNTDSYQDRVSLLMTGEGWKKPGERVP